MNNDETINIDVDIPDTLWLGNHDTTVIDTVLTHLTDAQPPLACRTDGNVSLVPMCQPTRVRVNMNGECLFGACKTGVGQGISITVNINNAKRHCPEISDMHDMQTELIFCLLQLFKGYRHMQIH